MALSATDTALIRRLVQDSVLRLPPHPLAAHTIGKLTVDDLLGKPTAPTPSATDSSERIATTAFVNAQGYLKTAPVASVFGRTGAVVAASGDYTAAEVTNAADTSSAATQAFAASVTSAASFVGRSGARGEVRLASDPIGSIELGSSAPSPGGQAPYIDFHYNSGTQVGQDFNARIINDQDGQLAFEVVPHGSGSVTPLRLTDTAVEVFGTALPGTEIAYNTQTGFVNVATSDTTIIGGSPTTYDGSPVMIEFWGMVVTPSVSGATVSFTLYDGATPVVIPGIVKTPAAANLELPVYLRVRITPTAGSHTYAIMAHASSTTGTPQVGGGTGTVSAGFPPAFLRVTQV